MVNKRYSCYSFIHCTGFSAFGVTDKQRLNEIPQDGPENILLVLPPLSGTREYNSEWMRGNNVPK